jgi:hypothetical protein
VPAVADDFAVYAKNGVLKGDSAQFSPGNNFGIHNLNLSIQRWWKFNFRCTETGSDLDYITRNGTARAPLPSA